MIGPDDDPDEVYPITLAPVPYYDNTSQSIGWGAVGVFAGAGPWMMDPF